MDKLYAQGVKPSAALRAYDSCKETDLWMQDELYLSSWEIEEISNTLTKHEDEVNTLVEKAASERAARYAYDHPKLPKGFVTITQLQGDLDLGDLRDEVEDFDFDGDITDAFSETADYKVDDNYHDLLTWLPDHTEWLEQAEFDGLLEGCKGDIYKMVQMAQYECFKSDLYDHREDICRYGTLDQKCAWKRVRTKLHPFSAERRLYGTETERANRLRRRPLLRRRRRKDGDKRPHGT